jgi:hypothetical protein
MLRVGLWPDAMRGPRESSSMVGVSNFNPAGLRYQLRRVRNQITMTSA